VPVAAPRIGGRRHELAEEAFELHR
jgi:hypothetical protein